MSHIFISYSTFNRDYAHKLAEKLREEGFDVWIDNRRLHSSEDWWHSIVLALRDCAAFLVILTPESDASRWVQREITLAEKYSKPIYPLLLNGDLNTPNWEIFVRTQVEDVRNGELPTGAFYNYLSQYAFRQSNPGINITSSEIIVQSLTNDPDIADEIANPPDPDTDKILINNSEVDTTRDNVYEMPSKADLNLDVTFGNQMFRNRRRSIFPSLIIALIGISGAAMLGVILISNRPTELTGIQKTSTVISLTNSYVVMLIDQTKTAFAPTLSLTAIEGTIQGEMNIAQTDIAYTQVAVINQQTANAVATDARSVVDQTSTATQWTFTPTINARATALARLAETQTQTVWITANSLIGIPTLPTNTFIPTIDPLPTVALTIEVSNTPSMPYITTLKNVNVRYGPGTAFDPPIGSLAADQSVVLLARSHDGQWYKIRYFDTLGWVFAAYTKPSIDPSQIAVDNSNGIIPTECPSSTPTVTPSATPTFDLTNTAIATYTPTSTPTLDLTTTATMTPTFPAC